MKRIIVLIFVSVLSSVLVFGQDSVRVNVNGDCAYYTKNLSTFTGLMFGEEPAVVSHMNINAKLRDFSLSAAYSGHYLTHRLQDNDSHFHMLDVYVSYKVKDLNISVGYEATYSDYKGQQDEFGQGVFAMAKYAKNKVSYNFIFFADPRIQNTYYISSVDLQVMKNVSIYLLGGYTNTKSTRWYGLGGLKYSKGNFFAGTYYMLDKDTPGPVVSIGMTF